MLKFTEAAEARDRVLKAEKDLSQRQNQLIEECNKLHSLRSGEGRTTIAEFEAYVNGISSHPKEYDRALELYHLNLQQFDNAGKDLADRLSEKIQTAAIGGSATAGLGAAAGAATAFGAPTVALAIATTFGTASTGTAISALAGGAATNAALAWLGGGALAAGGGGMAAGNALLALAGPVGIALAGTTLAAGVGWAAFKNNSTIDEANDIYKQLSATCTIVQTHLTEVSQLHILTMEHTRNLRLLFDAFVSDAPKDYLLFSDRQKELLGSMHNNVLALSRLLKLKPGEMADLTSPVNDSELETVQQSAREGAYQPNFVIPSEEARLEAIVPLKFTDSIFSGGPLAAIKRVFS